MLHRNYDHRVHCMSRYAQYTNIVIIIAVLYSCCRSRSVLIIIIFWLAYCCSSLTRDDRHRYTYRHTATSDIIRTYLFLFFFFARFFSRYLLFSRNYNWLYLYTRSECEIDPPPNRNVIYQVHCTPPTYSRWPVFKKKKKCFQAYSYKLFMLKLKSCVLPFCSDKQRYKWVGISIWDVLT